MRRVSSLCLSVLLCAGSTSAEDLSAINFKIARAPQSELLTQQTIRQSFQDSQGLMWFLTQEGLHRFDGYTVTRYTANENDSSSITHNNVRHILQDNLGDIWIATIGGGLIRYDAETRSFVKLEQDRYGNRLLSDNISAMYADDAGFIWIGYLEGKVSYYDPYERAIYHIAELNHSGEQYGAINDFAQHSYRNIWISTSDSGLLSYARFSNTLEHYSSTASDSKLQLPSDNLTNVAANQITGQLWIATQSEGVVQMDIASGRVTRFGVQQGLSDDSVNHIYFDQDMRLWLATDKGLNLRNSEGGFTVFDRDNSNLTDDLVFSVYQDRQKNYWIGTHYGLFAGYISQFDIFDSKTGLPSETVTSFTETSDGTIWIGTYNGIYRRRSSAPGFESITSGLPGFVPREQKTMALGSTGNLLLVGYRSRGIDIVNTTETADHYFPPSAGVSVKLSHSQITSIQDQNQSMIWVTTFGGGVNKLVFNEETDLVEVLQPQATKENDSREYAYHAKSISKKVTLVATTDGLLSYADNVYQLLKSSPESSISIERENILSIHLSQNDDVWFGLQYNGLARWTAEDQRASKLIFSRVITNPPIPSDTVYGIEEGDVGMLWLSTTNGLLRLDPDDLSIWPYFQSDGLQGNEFNFGASFKDSKGRLYFGGNRGYNRFHPSDIVDDTTPPRLSMTDIRVAGKSLVEDPSFFMPDLIELKYEDYYVEFNFSVMDYSNPRKNQYKYQLENFDADWIDIDDRHSITFTNLPSGNYVLKILGANPNRVWSDTPLRLTLYVHPPPWFTWWAFAGYLFVILSFAAMVKKNYDTNILRMQAETLANHMHVTAERAMDSFQEKLNTEQLLQQNLKAHYTGGLDLVSQLLEHQAMEIQDDTLLEQFANNQQRLRCLYEIEKNLIYLGPMLQTNFHQFVETLLSQHQSHFGLRDLDLPLVNTCTAVAIPAFIAAPLAIITNELVDNSFRHAFERRTGIEFLKVSFQEHEDRASWLLEIVDNGCSLPENVDPLAPTSLGLSLVKQFTERVGGTLTVHRRGGTHFAIRVPHPSIEAYDGS